MSERQAEELISRELVNRIFRWMLAATRDLPTAEDLTQNVFYEVIRSMHRFDPRRGTLDAWVNGFAAIQLTRHWADRKNFPAPQTISPFEVDHESWSILDRLYERDRLFRALGQLKDRDRQLVVRKHLFGQTLEEIGAAMGMSISAVTTALNRARQRLIALLEQGDHPLGEAA